MKTQEKGRVITWKLIAGEIVMSLVSIAGFMGAGRFIILNFPHSEISTRDFQLGWICIGVATLAALLVCIGSPLYMRRKGKKEDK